MGIESSNHAPEREEGGPLLSEVIDKTLSPDKRDGVSNAINVIGADEQKGKIPKRGERARQMREKREIKERIDRIADFFVSIGSDRGKRFIVEDLMNSIDIERMLEQTSAERRGDVILEFKLYTPEEAAAQRQSYLDLYELFEKIMLDYPLTDVGKERFGEFMKSDIRRRPYSFLTLDNVMRFMIRNYEVFEKIKLEDLLDGYHIKRLEAYVGAMYEIRIDTESNEVLVNDPEKGSILGLIESFPIK